jgi:hypothetical protein
MSQFIKIKSGVKQGTIYEIISDEEVKIQNKEQKVEETKDESKKKMGRPRLYEPGKNPNKLEYDRKWAKEHYTERKGAINELSKKYHQRCRASYHYVQELKKLVETNQLTLNNEQMYKKLQQIFLISNEENSLNPN